MLISLPTLPGSAKTATTLHTPSMQQAQPWGYSSTVQSVTFATGMGLLQGGPWASSSVQQTSIQVGSMEVWQRVRGAEVWAFRGVRRARMGRRMAGVRGVRREGMCMFGWLGGDAGEGVKGW